MRKQAVRAGIHSIVSMVSFLDDEAIELMLKHGTYLVPTLRRSRQCRGSASEA